MVESLAKVPQLVERGGPVWNGYKMQGRTTCAPHAVEEKFDVCGTLAVARSRHTWGGGWAAESPFPCTPR
eukprot:NODE_3924_length_510_cov_8.412148_g3348_i0.p3 GENE.NODE_3924_length_510_cov_8.412148_g3348_i0~~NODE_3924_length_510_cov_8.412148_g3348_i0.p3  ORF type:complete len:70 (+),score=15.35 NODE_3924_length_510_cov_8.412148_g3348_i0:297-506(+)